MHIDGACQFVARPSSPRIELTYFRAPARLTPDCRGNAHDVSRGGLCASDIEGSSLGVELRRAPAGR